MAALGRSLGPQAQRDALNRFGLLARAPLDLVESAPPRTPARWDEAVRGFAVTPAAFMAGLGAAVNGGVYASPTLRLLDRRGPVGEPVISPETSRQVAELLRASVLYGPSRQADAPGLGVGGKAGVAAGHAIGGRARAAAAFAAVFPYDDPRYAVLVLLDVPLGTEETRGRAGAELAAAPTAGAVIARIGPLLGVPRTGRSDGLLAAHEPEGSLEEGAP
jgi:cell division protein FtsI (penicillin-binding protein 3)